jgi:hypothetical protein
MRYTTKISEYVAAKLPIVTGRLPVAYDLLGDWAWRLPGDAPWSDEYIDGLAGLLHRATAAQVAERRAQLPMGGETFDQDAQRHRIGAFVADLLEDLHSPPP